MNISQSEFNELRDAHARLSALEGAGVDNWEGYDIALESYNKGKEVENRLFETLDEIIEVLCLGVYEPSERGAGVSFTDDAVEQARNIIIKLKGTV